MPQYAMETLEHATPGRRIIPTALYVTRACLHSRGMALTKKARVIKRLYFSDSVHGFEIPDRFVIGFGMDYNERYRDLNVSSTV